MAEPIGALRAELSANAARFEQDMKAARAAVRNNASGMRRAMMDFRKSVDTSIKSLFSLRSAAVAAAGITGLFLLTKRAIDLADGIAESADAVGLGVERFQEWQFGASKAGVATTQFNSNMIAFVKRVGEARAGMGPLVSGLKNLNPQLLQAIKNSKSQEEAFRLVADAIANARSATERAAIANAAFSRAGVTMVNFLRDGSAGLDRMSEDARRLGVVLSEEMIQQAAVAADELDDMAKVLQISLTRAALGLIPAMRDLSNTLTQPEFIEAIESLGRTIANLAALFVKFHPEILAVTAGLLAMNTVGGVAGKRIGVLAGVLSALATEGFLRLGQGADEANQRLQEFGATTEALAAGGVADIAGDPAKVDAFLKALDREIVALDNRILTFGETEGAIARVMKQQELQNLLQDENIQLTDEQRLTFEQYLADLEKGTDRLAKLTDAQRDAADRTRELDRAGERVGSTLKDGFLDAATSADDLSASLANVARRLLDIAMNAALSPFETAAGNLFKDLFKNLPGFAQGGSFTVGGRPGIDQNLVAFRASQGEQVTVDPRGGSAVGGAVVVYNIDARGADISVERRLMQALDQVNRSIEPRAVAVVASQAGRGGSFGKALGR